MPAGTYIWDEHGNPKFAERPVPGSRIADVQVDLTNGLPALVAVVSALATTVNEMLDVLRKANIVER